MKPRLNLKGREVVMVSECEGAYVIEPMRFLWPSEAKREAKRK